MRVAQSEDNRTNIFTIVSRDVASPRNMLDPIVSALIQASQNDVALQEFQVLQIQMLVVVFKYKAGSNRTRNKISVLLYDLADYHSMLTLLKHKLITAWSVKAEVNLKNLALKR